MKIFLQGTICVCAFLNMVLHRCNYKWMGCRDAWMSLLLCSVCGKYLLHSVKLCWLGCPEKLLGVTTSHLWSSVAVPATITIASASIPTSNLCCFCCQWVCPFLFLSSVLSPMPLGFQVWKTTIYIYNLQLLIVSLSFWVAAQVVTSRLE